MVSRGALRVSVFVITICWIGLITPYLMDYYFAHSNGAEFWNLSRFLGLVFSILGVPFCFWYLIRQIRID